MKTSSIQHHVTFIAWKVSVLGVFWSVFSHIRTEYGEVFPYSAQMSENMDQKIPNTDTFHTVFTFQ